MMNSVFESVMQVGGCGHNKQVEVGLVDDGVGRLNIRTRCQKFGETLFRIWHITYQIIAMKKMSCVLDFVSSRGS